MNVDTQIFRETTICGERPQCFNDVVGKASVLGELYQRDVLELVFNSLYDGLPWADEGTTVTFAT
jgi:hypothetical protein